MNMKTFSIFVSLLLLCVGCSVQEKNTPLAYHFDRPAALWEETFPLGNGRLGMMPDGGIDRESVVLNEISMWSGSYQDTDNPEASRSLPMIRKLLFEGKSDQAQQLMYDTFVCKGAGSALGDGANAPYGSYQLLGNLVLNYTYPDESPVSEYRRELNLDQAIASTTFKRGNIHYTREAFTSFAGDLGVFYLTADADKAIHFSLSMNRPEHATCTVEANDLVMRGQLPSGDELSGAAGNQYEARVRVLLPKGGSLAAADTLLRVENASEAIVLVSMGTSYLYHDQLKQQLTDLLAAAANKEYVALRNEHVRSYRELYGRVALDLGRNERSLLPMDQRLAAFAQDPNDPEL